MEILGFCVIGLAIISVPIALVEMYFSPTAQALRNLRRIAKAKRKNKRVIS